MSLKNPIRAEEFTGLSLVARCPGCGELERHQAKDFFRANPSLPLKPGETIQVQGLCAKRAARLGEFWAGGPASYFVQLPKETK